jgi:hypothetical protein
LGSGFPRERGGGTGGGAADDGVEYGRVAGVVESAGTTRGFG